MRTRWMMGFPAARKLCSKLFKVGRRAVVPEISRGWPSRVSCCMSIVMRAADEKSGTVYLLMVFSFKAHMAEQARIASSVPPFPSVFKGPFAEHVDRSEEQTSELQS